MKTILFPTMIVVAIAAGEANSEHKTQQSENYCMETQAAKKVIIYKNKPLDHDVALDNGSVLKADGVLIKKNGSRVLVNEGECVTPAGKVVGGKKP